MLIIYKPKKQMMLNEIKLISHSQDRSLVPKNLSVIFSFESESFFKKISYIQFVMIAEIFGIDYSKLNQNFKKLFNVNLLSSPVECTKSVSEDTSDCIIYSRNHDFDFKFGLEEDLGDMNFSELSHFLEHLS